MTVSQRAQHQDSETEAAKWNPLFYYYTCAYCDMSRCRLWKMAYYRPNKMFMYLLYYTVYLTKISTIL